MLVSACVQVPAMLPHNLEEQMNVSLRVGARDGARLSQPNRSPEITTAQCPALPVPRPAPTPPPAPCHCPGYRDFTEILPTCASLNCENWTENVN